MPQQPTPEIVFETLTAYQRSGALQGAIELDLFSAIAQGHSTAEAIAEHCGADARGIRILCDFLTVHGFLLKPDGRYQLSPVSAAFLVRSSPAYMGSMSDFLNSDRVQLPFRHVAAAVRNGGTVLDQGGVVSQEDPVWKKFASGIAPLARFTAEKIADRLEIDTAGPCKILDIAASHGYYGITLARRNAQAEVYAADWPGVLEAASENARREGLSERHHLIPGDAFKSDFGEGYDLALLTNFLHHFDPPTCVGFLRKVKNALKPSGRTVTLEFVPNPDRVTPAREAAFSLVMLCTTPSGDAYTFAELEEMFREAGFRRSEVHHLEEASQHLVISHS